MPIGAAIGTAVAGVGSAVISSGASNHASDVAQQTAQQNNALQSQIYQQNTANLSPWMTRGNAAGGQQAALLGLAPSTPDTVNWAGYLDANPNALAAFNVRGQNYGGWGNVGGYSAPVMSKDAFAQEWYQQHGGDLSPYTTPGTNPATAAANAFSQFRNSDGYQFRFNQGLNTVNNNLATKGALNSGAALKALNDYAQGTASNEFGKYMGYLDNLDQRGMAAGSAIAGVGQNYANAVSSNNNNAASAAGNAAIAGANGINSAISSGLNAFGMYQGLNSSYSNSAGSFATPRGFGTGPIGNGGGEWT